MTGTVKTGRAAFAHDRNWSRAVQGPMMAERKAAPFSDPRAEADLGFG